MRVSMIPLSAGRKAMGSRIFVRLLLLISLVVAGLWARSVLSTKGSSREARRWTWDSTRTITLYFSNGTFLVPVSRQMAVQRDVPRAVLQALIEGPNASTNLVGPIPHGVAIRSVKVAEMIAYADLSSAFREASDMQAAETA